MTDFIPDRFSGKTVIVTGAGSGIGKATAARMAKEGATVVAADLSAERLAELESEYPDLRIVTVAGDISNEEDIHRVVAAAGGQVDCLANVAGIMDGFQAPSEIDDATWDRVFAVNVTATMRLTRAVLPLMIAAGKGSIVNISSEAGLRGSAAGAAYTASKHAVNGFTKSVTLYHRGQGIRCNAVAPGGVQTNIEAKLASELAATVLFPHHAAAGKMAEAYELAATITYLLSDDASNMNGAIVPCDAGWSAV